MNVGRPVSFAQQRLWFLDQLERGNPAYHVQTAVRLSGRLDTPALEASLSEIVRRHEILRTTFQAVQGEVRQIVSAESTVRLALRSIDQPSTQLREVEAKRVASEEALRSFDLGRGPLMRPVLLRLDPELHVLILTMHHIVTDGWSTGVLFRELGLLYRAFSNGRPSPLAELPIQYADFAEWQRDRLRGDLLQDQLLYWKRQLAGTSILNLPTDRPRPNVQTFRGARKSFLLSKEATQKLKALGLDQGATLYMTLLTVFVMLLHSYSGQEDIVVGTPIAGRSEIETEGLIGFFINPLVLRIDASGDPALRDLLARVREVALEAYAHQDLPFEKVVEALHPQRTLAFSPLFQVWFVLQNVPPPLLVLDGLTVTPLEPEYAQWDRGPANTARHDLRLGFSAVPEGLSGTFEYKTDLFEDSTIDSMIFQYVELVHRVVQDPEKRLHALMDRLAQVQSEQEARRSAQHYEEARGSLKVSRRRPIRDGRNPFLP